MLDLPAALDQLAALDQPAALATHVQCVLFGMLQCLARPALRAHCGRRAAFAVLCSVASDQL